MHLWQWLDDQEHQMCTIFCAFVAHYAHDMHISNCRDPLCNGIQLMHQMRHMALAYRRLMAFQLGAGMRYIYIYILRAVLLACC